MDAQKSGTNVLRRGKRRSEPAHMMTGTRLELNAIKRGQNTSGESSIWDTLEEAKRKQESIRNRVRKYGHEEEDSDYNDSPLCDNERKNCKVVGGDKSENDSDKHDDELNLDLPLKGMEVQEQNRTPAQNCCSPSFESSPTTRKKIFSDMSQNKSFKNNTHGRTINNSIKSKYSINNQRQQLISNTDYTARKYSLNGRKGEKLPVLTPEEAIRLVMDQHAYISDSERTEEDHPIRTRRGSISKGSSSTNETAMNTVASDSGHNRTPEGKRVLVLRKKMYREDTHPRTSKDKKYQKNYRHESPIQPSPQKRSIENHPRIQDGKEDKQQQDSTSRVPTNTQRAQVQVENNEYSTLRLTQLIKPDVSRPPKSLILLRQQGVEEIENQFYCQPKPGEEDKLKVRRDSLRQGKNDNQVDHDDDSDDEETSVEKESHLSKKHIEDPRDYDATGNKRSEEHDLPSALNDEAMIEKEIFLLDMNDKNYCSDSDEYDDDDDFLGRDKDIVQRQKEDFILDEQEDEDDSGDSHVGDEEDDWPGVSWKTAKTSRSTISKYSKSSSTSLWIRASEVNNDINQDDNIDFFDAIQESEEMDRIRSVKVTDAPPAVICNEIDDGDANGISEGGWRGIITNIVGYTISALSASKDEKDHNGGGNAGLNNFSVASPTIAAPTAPRPLMKRTSHSKNSPIPLDSTKAVPSRELEIIRKCQEAKSQRLLEVDPEETSTRNKLRDIQLRRKEEAARARVWREVMAYREMMDGMGKGEKLAPLDSKDYAQEYNDRLAMVKTLKDQEKKMNEHERNMVEMEMDEKLKPEGCRCACVVS